MADIEVHGKTLKLVLSICKVLAEDDLTIDDNLAVNNVEYLETVWHSVWLRTLEWECLIEQSLTSQEDDIVETDAEEDILKVVVGGQKILKYVSEENICDSDGISSDSGFSDHSDKYDTNNQVEIHNKIVTGDDDSQFKYKKGEQGERRTRKSRKSKRKTRWSCSKALAVLAFSSFILILLLIISHIKCYNNTCAISIPSHIRYYNHGRHVI